MQLFYDDIALHDLGTLFVSAQETHGEPEEAPQRLRHMLLIKIKSTHPGYADNLDAMNRVRAALKQQAGRLRWVDDNGTERLNQPVTIAPLNWPENPNEKGTYLQALEVTFFWYENIDKSQTNTEAATFQRTGVNTPVIALDTVERFKFSTDVRRYSSFRSHREQATGRLEATGKVLGNTKDSVENRRAVLLTAIDQIRTEIRTGMDGRVKFGPFDQVVRVENFVADIDQAGPTPHIAWSLSATWSEFPNEAGYAQAEVTVTTREEREEGKTYRLFSGKIESHSEEAAISKLDSLRSTFVGAEFTATRQEKRSDNVSGADGTTFIRLTFEEEFKKITATTTDWECRISDTEETKAGTFRRTYSGWVEAKGATFDAAYQVAAAKARTLGDNKHAFKVDGQITVEDKQLSVPAERQMTGDLIVRVEFSFEYQLKGTRLYAEISGELNRQTFGVDTETVSGFITAADANTARNLYTIIKNGYGSYVVRSERLREDRQKVAVPPSSMPVGTTRTPPKAGGTWPAGTTRNINTSEVTDDAATGETVAGGASNPPLLGPNYVRQWMRLDFSFELHRPKGGTNGAISYEIAVRLDFAKRRKLTSLAGQVAAASEALAEEFLDTFIDKQSFGQRLESGRRHKYLKKLGAKTAFAQGAKERGAGSALGSVYEGVLEFEENFSTRLVGDAAILQCSIEEEIECSGPRVVTKATATSTDVFQECGTQSGRRTISGEVEATDETTAFEWIKRQKNLPLAGQFTKSGTEKDLPPKVSVVPTFEPLTEGVIRGRGETGEDLYNANLVRVRFTFTRLYEELTLPLE